MKPYTSIINNYLQALEEANLEKVLQLFDKNAIVHSPLYGKRSASDFYKELFQDTNQSVLTLKHLFHSKEEKVAVAVFIYNWTMQIGESVEFEVVDIFYFNEEGKIKELKIIYDSVLTKSAFNKKKG